MCVATFTFEIQQKSDNTFKLSLSNNKGVYDITVLNNLPISELNLSNTDVSDITVLASMPLTKLDLSHTHTVDLSPLKNKDLKELNLWKSNVRILTALKNSPLEKLYLSGKWSDPKELARINSLKTVFLSRFIYNQQVINDMKQHFSIVYLD